MEFSVTVVGSNLVYCLSSLVCDRKSKVEKNTDAKTEKELKNIKL